MSRRLAKMKRSFVNISAIKKNRIVVWINSMGKGGIMAIVVTQKRSEFPKAGSYAAELIRVDIVEDDISTEKVLLQFQLMHIVQKSGVPFFVYRVCSPFISSDSCLEEVLEAILERELSVAELKNGIDLESLVGQKLMLEVLDVRSQTDVPFVRLNFHRSDFEDEQPF
jgi:hypothetical protein